MGAWKHLVVVVAAVAAAAVAAAAVVAVAVAAAAAAVAVVPAIVSREMRMDQMADVYALTPERAAA